MRLFHFTCGHGLAGISHDGATRPHPQPMLRGCPPITWLTDLDVPDRAALGLTSVLLSCDRTRYRLDVDADDVTALLHWPAAAREWRIQRPVRDLLECGGAMPVHWWVTTEPIGTEVVDLVETKTGAAP